MNERKKESARAKGWKFGGAKDFLGLTEEEAAYVEIKLMLAETLRRKRLKKRLGQVGLAKLVGSSQSRVAKMEAGDNTVSIDLLVRSLLRLGISNPELGRAIAKAR